jgi:mannose-6-phosphate isomerase-like protein (cupin superfamily)
MKIITRVTCIVAAGTPAKIIEEFIGRVNSHTEELSIARMNSPQGWSEPGQKPDFTEYSLVLKGSLQVETGEGIHRVKANEVFVSEPGEWVRYSTPFEGGAEYIAVCIPAFSPETVHRDG